MSGVRDDRGDVDDGDDGSDGDDGKDSDDADDGDDGEVRVPCRRPCARVNRDILDLEWRAQLLPLLCHCQLL